MAREKKVDEKLEALLDGLNKKFKSDDGDPMAVIYGKQPIADVKRFSSGSLVLDAIVGGGIPEGRIIEIYGPNASGKTSVALTTLGNVQRDPDARHVAFFDFEHAIDPNYAKTLGVDMDNLVFLTPRYAEEGLQMLDDMVNSGLFSLIVVDSVAAMVPKVEWEGELEDQNMALMARILSRSLKKLVGAAARNKTTVIFINQTREKVGLVFGNPVTTTGGNALPFYASQRIAVARREKVVEDGENIGHKVRYKIEKNKVGKPHGVAETILTFNKGINKAAEVLDENVGVKHGIISKKGNTYTEVATGERIGVGRPKSIAFLEENPEVMDRISNALSKVLNKAEEDRDGDEEVSDTEEDQAEMIRK